METQFNLEAIDKSFQTYSAGKMVEGVVILKRDDGVIFNIGGKRDSFIPREDFSDYDQVKLGDRYKVVITNKKNEEGMIISSKSQADYIIVGSQTAEKIKLGSKFTFVVTNIKDGGLCSRLGEYEIYVPADEVSSKEIGYVGKLKNKQLEAIAIEINREKKFIIASVKMLADQIEEQNQKAFWSSIFINKVVEGTVVRIVPFGAFVNVGGIDCLLHISDISYDKINSVDEVLKVGETRQFRVIKVDKENKKVSLGLKQIYEKPKIAYLKELIVGEKYNGEVIKILAFGAIIKLENGAEGLLHVSDATTKNDARIYQIVKLGQKLEVTVKNVDIEKGRCSFSLIG